MTSVIAGEAAAIASPFRVGPVQSLRPGAPDRDGETDLVGAMAGLGAAAVWGGALAVTRLGVGTGGALGPHDIALLRFVMPALVLLPLLLRTGLAPARRVGIGATLVLIAGGGSPFVLVAGLGLRATTAAEAGALLPGTMPVFAALLSVALLRERIGRQQMMGFAVILGALLLASGREPDVEPEECWLGRGLLLGASVLAAAYSVALRRSQIDPWHATALVACGSLLGFGPVYLLALEPGIGTAPWTEVIVQVACQGLLSGLLGTVAFGVAVRRLGVGRAAAFGGLTPAAAALSGLLLLGETPGLDTALGVGAAGIGVVLVASGRSGTK